MTSREPLIPGESREALLAHLEHWNKLYPGVETDELLSDLVRDAAFEQWLLFRYQRQYDATLAKLYKTEIDDWTPEHHKTYQLRERYLNAAQRRFNRHRSNILQYQSNLRSQARENRAADTYAAEKVKIDDKNAENKPSAPQPPAKRDNIQVQFILVRQKDGKTETRYTPDNQHLLDYMAKFYFETTLVVRAIRFEDHCVPPEYAAFADRAAELKGLPYDGRIELPITFRNLRIAVEREKELGGHVRDWPDLLAEDEPIIQMKFKGEEES
jgi:hypothetical protein